MSADQKERQAEINASTARKKAAARQEEIQKQKNIERQQSAQQAALPRVVLDGSLNTGGSQSALDTSRLNTNTKRKSSRIASYNALQKIAREGTGQRQQLANTMAETGNKRGQAFQSGFDNINTNVSSRQAQNEYNKASQEAQYVEEDKIAAQEFEKGIVDAYYARAANMDAKARAYLQSTILDQYGINLDNLKTKYKGETQT